MGPGYCLCHRATPAPISLYKMPNPGSAILLVSTTSPPPPSFLLSELALLFSLAWCLHSLFSYLTASKS